MTAAVLDSGVMGCATLRMLGVANASVQRESKPPDTTG